LSQTERDLADAAKSIDEKYARPTEAEVLALLEKLSAGADEETTTEAEREAVSDLG
jgi:hypothetical protein